ncbi:MAG: hypothetical protein Kow0068_22880 [Marinilabiliales bacterium]
MKNFLILFLIIVIFASCNSGERKDNTIKLQKGEVTLEKADVDSLITYYYYIPTDFDTSKHYPAIYFIDAHARGKLPVEKYKSLAEKFGYIIIGSNNAKNELPYENQLNIYRILKNDVEKKFHTQKMRFYLCGFSGGSRVASNIAINTGEIPAVIGCGAGFPQINKPLQKSFDYLGMVGNLDFNLGEMVYLNKNLKSINFPNELVIFDGKHDWPPDSVMNIGFVWFETSAIKKYTLPKTDDKIKQIIKELNSFVNSQKNNYRKYLAAITSITFINDISQDNQFKTIADSLEKLDEVKSAVKQWEKNINLEIAEQQQYVKNLGEKNLAWWRNEIKTLQSRNDSKSKRLLNYISLLFFMNIDGMLNQNAISPAENALPLYKLADPDNPDVYYLYACLYAMQNDAVQAIENLDSSIAKGFIDKEKLVSDQRLNNIRNNPGFSELLEKLQ